MAVSWVAAQVCELTGPLSFKVKLSDGWVLRRHVDHVRKHYGNGEDLSTRVSETDLLDEDMDMSLEQPEIDDPNLGDPPITNTPNPPTPNTQIENAPNLPTPNNQIENIPNPPTLNNQIENTRIETTPNTPPSKWRSTESSKASTFNSFQTSS